VGFGDNVLTDMIGKIVAEPCVGVAVGSGINDVINSPSRPPTS